MSDSTQSSLSSFMKKKISEKSSKGTSKLSNSSANFNNKKKSNSSNEDGQNQEPEMTEEEQVAEAKKASRNKASNRDQSGMIKRMFIQNIIKYTLLIASLVVFAFGLLRAVPLFAEFLGGFLHKLFMGAFK